MQHTDPIFPVISIKSYSMLTFSYLAAFNWWLVLCPSSLSHDWQMGSIPLLTSISDARNLLTLWALASTILMIHKSWLDFEVMHIDRSTHVDMQ